MPFSSNFFIFAYLPVVLIVYFARASSARNFILLVASIAFYAFDADPLTWLLKSRTGYCLDRLRGANCDTGLIYPLEPFYD